jgi:CHAT domain-containing protein
VQPTPNPALAELSPQSPSVLRFEPVTGIATSTLPAIQTAPEGLIPSIVRVTFQVELNPVLKTVQVEGNRVLPPEQVERIFKPLYGKPLNLNQLQDGIKQVNKWYQDKGYVLAQVLDSLSVSPDGVVTLKVAEGEIAEIQVRYNDNEGNSIDQPGNIPGGRLPNSTILRAMQAKPGEIFKRPQMEQDLQHVHALGFEDTRLGLEPSETDRRKVIVVLKIVDAKDKAERLLNAASRLAEKDNNASKRRALQTYQELLQYHRLVNDQRNQAIVLNRMATVHSELEDYPQALDFYQRSLQLAKATNLPVLEALTLANIGNTHQSAKNYSQSFDVYVQSLQLAQSLETSPELEKIDSAGLFAFGQSSRLGRYSEVYFVPNRVKSMDDKTSVIVSPSFLKSISLFKLGELHQRLGEYPQALHRLKSALPGWNTLAGKDKDRAINYELVESFNLAYIASVYADLGEAGEAAAYRDQAVQRFLTFSQRANQQSNNQFSQLLLSFSYLLDTATTIDGGGSEKLANLMETFFAALPNRDTAAFWLVIAGDSLAEQGHTTQALKRYQQALDRLKTTQDTGTRLWLQVKALNGIRAVYVKRASPQAAIAAHRRALALLEATPSSAPASAGPLTVSPALKVDTLNQLGHAYFEARQFSQSRAAYQQARDMGIAEAKDSAKIATSLLGLAKLERVLGNFAQSQTQAEAALKQLEAAALKTLERPALPVLTQPNPPVNTSTDSAGRPVLSISGRPQSSTSIRVGNFDSFRDSIAFLTSKQSYYEFYIDLLMDRYQQTRAKQYETEAFRTSERFQAQSLRTLLQKSSKNFNAETPAASALLKEIQATLDDDTILLEFFLGEQRSYLWAVTNNEISSYSLPPQSQIDPVVREFYDYLTNPSLRVRPNRRAQAGMVLSQMILGDVAPKLVHKKRMLVVADGGLRYIPFSALPMPIAGVNGREPTLASLVDPLLVKHEVVNLPSAATAIAIRRNRATRPAATKTLTVLADPIFGQTDERLNRTPIAPSLGTIEMEQFYPRLPGTQRQAEQILALVPAGQRSQRFGAEASRQNALSPDLGNYRIIHFATHGLSDSQRPERSGMMLAMVNNQGELQRSLLSPPDIFNTLQLSADLVVLNGCRTGLGTGAAQAKRLSQTTQEQGMTLLAPSGTTLNGEGAIGLPGSFLYAGADRVVASLWSVEEKATTDLMVRFYTNMLQGRDGKKLTAAAALREAQLSMWRDRRWESPYDWAGFVLQGEWR